MKKKHNSLDASKRFRTVGGPPSAAVPDDSIAQTVGGILQTRFDPLSSPYDDDADPRFAHSFLVFCLRNLLAPAVNF